MRFLADDPSIEEIGMTLGEMHPTCWGVETDFFHFLAAVGWTLCGGLALFFAAPGEGTAATENSRGHRIAIAMAFLLFGAACTAGLLDNYGHLLASFATFGAVAQAAAVATVLLGLTIVPVPRRWRQRVPEVWLRVTVVVASVVLLALAPAQVSWWIAIAAAVSSAGLLLLVGNGRGVPFGRFEMTIERHLGVMYAIVSLAWGVPEVVRSWIGVSEISSQLSRSIGIAQGTVLSVGAALVFVGLWRLYLRLFAVMRVRASVGVLGLRPAFVLPLLEAAVLAAGYFFAGANSEKVEGFVAHRVLAEIRALAASVDWDAPASGGNAPGSVEKPADGPVLSARLQHLLELSPSFRAAMIWDVKRGAPSVVAEVDSDTTDQPFVATRLLPARFLEERGDPEAAVFWRDRPLLYSWALALVPAREFTLEHSDWNLALAFDARGLADPIAAHRLQSLAIVALMTLLVGFGVVHSVRSLSETELRALKEKAEAENRAKSDLLAMVSHEVRTPLQSVLGFAELAEASRLPEDAARHIRAVRSQGAVLLRIVQDILDFSALRSGQLHLVPETVSLRDLAIEVQRAFAERAAAKGLVITVDVDERVPAWVMVDRVRLSQVLLNLVGNAVKFTHRGGVRIAVSVSESSSDAAEIAFTVSDTGTGIPAEQLRRIFEPFRKLRDDDTPFGGGVGLGLAICQQVVELLGSQIVVDSNSEDGTTFGFRLRLLLAAGPVPAASAMPCVVPNATPTALAGLRVLLVDDNPHVRELLREFLRRLGADVIARPDGTSALAAVRARPFDVVLLDLRLPDTDVGTLARGIREISGSPQEPWLVGISAGVSDVEIQAALEHGLNDFMLKPVSMAGLAETIRMSPVGVRVVVPADAEGLSIEASPQTRRAFFDETAPVIARIKECCRQNRGRQAAAEAHYLANGCLMLGLDKALALCRELEKLSESDDLEAAFSLARRLRLEFETEASSALDEFGGLGANA